MPVNALLGSRYLDLPKKLLIGLILSIMGPLHEAVIKQIIVRLDLKI